MSFCVLVWLLHSCLMVLSNILKSWSPGDRETLQCIISILHFFRCHSNALYLFVFFCMEFIWYSHVHDFQPVPEFSYDVMNRRAQCVSKLPSLDCSFLMQLNFVVTLKWWFAVLGLFHFLLDSFFFFFLLADEIAVSISELLSDLHNSFWLMFFWQLEVKIYMVVCTCLLAGIKGMEREMMVFCSLKVMQLKK